jgi:GNAT superfamily N-acetyltransferase
VSSTVASPAFSLRPIAPGDRAAVARFYGSLSAESREARFHGAAPAIGADATAFFCGSDHVCREGIVAEAIGAGGEPEIVGHLVLEPAGPGTVEMAVAVADAWQRRGVGRAMLLEAVAWARRAGVERLTASMRLTNVAVMGLVRSLGLPVRVGPPDAGVVDVTVDLGRALLHAA